MGIGVSVFLIAVGAVMAFALDVEAEGFNVNTVGIILMVAGALGLLATMTIFGGRRGRVDDVVVEERTRTY